MLLIQTQQKKMIKHEYIYKEKFEFEAGGNIEDLKIVYHSSERP